MPDLPPESLGSGHSTDVKPPPFTQQVEDLKKLSKKRDDARSQWGTCYDMLENLQRLRKLARYLAPIEREIAKEKDDEVKEILEQQALEQREVMEYRLNRLIKEAVGKETVAKSATGGFIELTYLIPGKAVEREKMTDVSYLDDVIKRVGKNQRTLSDRDAALSKRVEALEKSLTGKAADPKHKLERCLAKCKEEEHGLCDNPAIYNGRCWIFEHRYQELSDK